ncbi:biosynthetic-type acetolactate synthase large subunit [Leptolinea tardivitalis]|uniref:Acetolactate synthase n=1 Tax=Leptolinea tardivitalis TaxID=229920 RepID=A0A0P6WWB6_9CHLR|nr:biosynthetic-type acetolactate synthase large subunit [Leptolinea tardivitalis]KPL73184.1 acetolactate synthase catalytic subunit [Leptolinea tardivitalis]GAP21286.1 acetolactate synthase, large subunit [Leptolinea tardivitalis]
MKLTGAQIVWECLQREGVEVVFGYPGGASLPIYDALHDYNIHHVLVRHEQGAAHMADGYARASGKVGVALATSGPGATNLVTGIATAMMDSVPVVFITAQVHSKLIGYDAFQEVDVTGITLPITKHNYLVTDVKDIAHTLREAFYIARTGRPGPVLVDITKDAQQNSIEYDPDSEPIHLRGYRPTALPVEDDIQKAVTMIHSAKRPVILAGHGVLQSGAMKEVLEFAERTQTPVAMTLLGISGFPASHPLNLGMMGMHGEAWVNHAIQDADLLLAFGMRFDDRVTGDVRRYATHARKIHIDIDPAEINKNVRVDLALVGDLSQTLEQILKHVKPGRHDEWLASINEMKGSSSVRDIQNLPDNGHLYAAHVINDLWNITKGNAVIVTDVGQNQMWTAQYYRQDNPSQFITSGGLGTMGFGLPAGIGAKFGQPDKEVWVICGDGGFQMTQAELATAAQEGIKVNIAILNNGYLGMVRQWQEFFYDRRYSATPMKSPDFIKIADAHGLTGMRVTTRADVETAIQTARETEGTVVIDFRVEKEDSVYPMVPTGSELKEMIRRPLPAAVAVNEAVKVEA